MSSKSVICCVITIFLVSTNSAFSLDITPSLERVQRAILSENPTQELNDIIVRDLSRTKVQSYVRSLIPKSIESLQRSSENDDLIKVLIRKYAQDPRVIEAASSNDVQSILDVLNNEIGGVVLVTNNTSIVIDVDAVAAVLRAHTSAYIQKLYPDDFILQIVANTVAEKQIKVLSADLKAILSDKEIPLELVNEAISILSNPGRRKRDLVSDLVLSVLRPNIASILTPIHTEFNTIVMNVLNVILSLYRPTLPSGVIMGLVTNFTNVIVIRVAEVVVSLQVDVNTIFDNLINGTVTTTARRRRDIENIYELETVARVMSHRRVRRDILGDIFSVVTTPFSLITSSIILPVTNTLNVIVKKIVLTLLSSQYQLIGSIVTLPIRFILNTLIDTIIPCSDCWSIV